jgi:hypothetical protein
VKHWSKGRRVEGLKCVCVGRGAICISGHKIKSKLPRHFLIPLLENCRLQSPVNKNYLQRGFRHLTQEVTVPTKSSSIRLPFFKLTHTSARSLSLSLSPRHSARLCHDDQLCLTAQPWHRIALKKRAHAPWRTLIYRTAPQP